MVYEALIMGMPVTIDVVDCDIHNSDIEKVFKYLRQVDEQFSTYKKTSEISQINANTLSPKDYSQEMKKVLRLCEKTKKETNGFFDISYEGKYDPSGLVKGYAIWNSTKMLTNMGFHNFYIEIAGDIQTKGLNHQGKKWSIGIENPFNRTEIIKVVHLSGVGIATSGTYIRGNHIYNPITSKKATDIASATVVAKNIYEADRFATAAFAMGLKGIDFLEHSQKLAGFIVTLNKTVLKTTNFSKFEQQ